MAASTLVPSKKDEEVRLMSGTTAPISKLSPEHQATLEKMEKLKDEIIKSFKKLPFAPDKNDLLVLAQELLSPCDSLSSEATALYSALKPPVEIAERPEEAWPDNNYLG